MNEQLMDLWLEELDSGKHEQSHGEKFDGEGYCCLGIADEFVFGTTWSKEPEEGVWVDRYGLYDFLMPSRAETLGLDRQTTSEEREAFTGFSWKSSSEHMALAREKMLSQLNDNGVAFSDIAAFIRRMGWDRDGVEETS